MRRVTLLVWAFVIWAGVFGTFVAPATAQGPINATTEQGREYDAAFQEMLRKPADLDVLFKFTTIATKTGDYEGAISALERMLLVNPDLPRVRPRARRAVLPPGLLRGGTHLSRDRAGLAGTSSEVRARAEQYLTEVAKRSSPRVSSARPSPACATSRTPISVRRPRAFVCSAKPPTSANRRSAPPTGRRRLGLCPPHLRPRHPGQGRAGDASSPAMPTASSSFPRPTCRSWT